MASKSLEKNESTLCLAKYFQVELFLQFGMSQSCNYISKPQKISAIELTHNSSALHNTPDTLAARKQMLEGEYPKECEYCWRNERSGLPSNRHLSANQPWSASFKDQIYTVESQNILPKYLEVSFSNLCNLACVYCFSGLSSKWQSEMERFGSFTNFTEIHDLSYLKKNGLLPDRNNEVFHNAFWRWWPQVYPQLKVLRITGGEPSLHRELFQILDYVREHPHPALEFSLNSNLSTPNSKIQEICERLEELIKNKCISQSAIYVSLDSWGKAAEYIRYGLDLNLFLKNLETVLNVSPSTKIRFMSTQNALSIFGYSDLVEYVKELKIKYKNREPDHIFLDTNFVESPDFLSSQILPTELKQKINDTEALFDSHFLPLEKEKFRNYQRFANQTVTPNILKNSRWKFMAFFAELDRRRNTSLTESIPEAKSLFENFEQDLKSNFHEV